MIGLDDVEAEGAPNAGATRYDVILQTAGCAIVAPNAGDMIGEVCPAIEMGCDTVDIGKTIHPHPTLGEPVGMAAEVAHGSYKLIVRKFSA